MIVARFKVQCRPERTEEMGAAIAAWKHQAVRFPASFTSMPPAV
jgi:hypothetical protein